jgi:hypothetical protein
MVYKVVIAYRSLLQLQVALSFGPRLMSPRCVLPKQQRFRCSIFNFAIIGLIYSFFSPLFYSEFFDTNGVYMYPEEKK